jgi:hypothetical protein
MGNKNGSYETLSDETKDLLIQRTGKINLISFFLYVEELKED